MHRSLYFRVKAFATTAANQCYTSWHFRRNFFQSKWFFHLDYVEYVIFVRFHFETEWHANCQYDQEYNEIYFYKFALNKYQLWHQTQWKYELQTNKQIWRLNYFVAAFIWWSKTHTFRHLPRWRLYCVGS